MKRYFELVQNGSRAELNIYGDIVPDWCCCDADMSANKLSQMLDALEGVDEIDVRINSFGGDVSEGLAIYNSLRRHSARVTTTCDGFACSIASVIFMAGDERVMSHASLLMIHNAWAYVGCANASEMRKQAEDLDKITQASKNAYMSHVTISEEELASLMDEESWISPEEALDMGFATCIEAFQEGGKPSQSARHSLMQIVAQSRGGRPGQKAQADPKPDDGEQEPPDPDEDPEEKPGDEGGEPDPDEDPEKDPEEEPANQAAQAAFFMALNQAIDERSQNANEGQQEG